ncbi:hypothetical protein [Neosynechococcus sphagnicola]|nr:hypothetical protein [Neosynechococcus sphagnicola]
MTLIVRWPLARSRFRSGLHAKEMHGSGNGGEVGVGRERSKGIS